MPDIENATTAGAEGAGEGEKNTEKKDDGTGGTTVVTEGKEGEGEAPKPKESEDTDGDDGKEPVVRARKTAKDFIIERQQRKIEKLKKEDTSGKSDEGKEGEGDSDEDDVDPEDEKVIAKVVSKHLAPIFEKQIEVEDEAEVAQFVTANPDFKPYEARVKRNMRHPSRREVPIEELFYAAAGKDLMKIGAKRAKEAEDEANRSGTGGGSARSTEGEGKVDWANAPKEDFEKKKREILYGV